MNDMILAKFRPKARPNRNGRRLGPSTSSPIYFLPSVPRNGVHSMIEPYKIHIGIHASLIKICPYLVWAKDPSIIGL